LKSIPAQLQIAWRGAGLLLALTLPLTIYRGIGPSTAAGVLDIYVRPGLYLSDFLWVAVAVLLVIQIGSDWEREPGPTRQASRWVTIPLLALAALGFLGVPWATSPMLALNSAIRWLAAVAVYYWLARSDLSQSWWMRWFVIGLAVQSLIGLGQVVRQGPLGLPGELALRPEQAGAAIIEVGGTRWLRADGLTFHPNVLGGFLSAGLLGGLPLLKRWRFRALWWLMWATLLLTFSRSAWLAVALALPPAAVWLAARRRPLRRALVITGLVAGLITLLWGLGFRAQLTPRLNPSIAVTEVGSLAERTELNKVSAEAFAARPWLGIGAGNTALVVAESDVRANPQPTHNVPLLLAGEVGVLGGLLWLWLWLAPIALIVWQRNRAEDLAVTAVAAWFALGLIALWDGYPWAIESGRWLTVVSLGFVGRQLPAQFRAETPKRIWHGIRARLELARRWLREARWLWVPVVAFLVSRLIIFGVAYLAGPLIIDNPDPAPYHLRPPTDVLLDVFGSRWDTGFYVSIAEEGYRYRGVELPSVPFFPLLPLLMRAVGSMVGDTLVAGILVTNVSLMGAAILFYRLVEEEWGESIAGRSVWYLLIFPSAFFGSAIYTESLTLLLVVGALYLARQGFWESSALLGFFVALTRLLGLMAAPLLLVEWWMQRGRPAGERPPLAAALAALAVPLGTVAYMVYLQQAFDDPLAFLHGSAAWGRGPQSPLITLAELLQRPTAGWWVSVRAGWLPLDSWLDLLFALLFGALGLVLLRQRRWSEGIFVIGSVAIQVSSGLLMSQRRYVWVLFPAFVVLARWGERSWVDRAIAGLSVAGLALFTALFANGYWVG
jgi:O-antigen ligase